MPYESAGTLPEVRTQIRDWVVIQGFGLLIGGILGLLFGMVTQRPLAGLVAYGAFSGIATTLFAMFSVTLLQSYILIRIHKGWWKILGVGFSFLSGVMGPYIGYLFLKPILHLDAQITDILLVSGVLAALIGIILHNLVTRRNERDHLDRELVKSRLMSLEAQINPHFLFNALNSISELMHKNVNDADRAMMQLATFLRYGMDEKSVISVEQELQCVRNFIALNNIRFSGKITYEENLAGQTRSWHVPKFSIQLLVENSIKHGMLPDGTLSIRVGADEEGKILYVEDNGNGFEHFTPGFGLKNLQERLAIINKGTLEAFSKSGKTRFSMKLGRIDETATG